MLFNVAFELLSSSKYMTSIHGILGMSSFPITKFNEQSNRLRECKHSREVNYSTALEKKYSHNAMNNTN